MQENNFTCRSPGETIEFNLENMRAAIKEMQDASDAFRYNANEHLSTLRCPRCGKSPKIEGPGLGSHLTLCVTLFACIRRQAALSDDRLPGPFILSSINGLPVAMVECESAPWITPYPQKDHANGEI